VAVKIVSRLAVAIRWATYCLQTHPIGDFPLWNENTRIVIGRQPWISVYSNTGRGIEYPTRMRSFFNSRGERTSNPIFYTVVRT
jgi:hypothetical protein